MVQSVRPSVCPSHLFDYAPIIISLWNFQESLPMTEVMSMQKVKVRGQRSRSQRSNPNLAVSGPQLQFEFTYGDEMHIAWCCLEEVPYYFSRSSVKFQGHTAKKSSILTQIGRFQTVTPVCIHQWLRNDTHKLKQSCLPFHKIMSTDDTICVYNLIFLCTIFLMSWETHITLKSHIIFPSNIISECENLPRNFHKTVCIL